MTETVVEPRIRGFLCLTAHPEGCAANVRRQVDIATKDASGEGLGTVLVIGSSTGYGLASALTASFGYGADVLGVCFEKPSDGKRPGSAGWYNLAEAHRLAKDAGRRFETINGDAFSAEIKQQVISSLKERFGKVDMVVYSLAAPKRTMPDGSVASSVLKPIGETYSGKTIDLREESVGFAKIEPANDQEVEDTRKVMGGEDWADWINLLRDEGLLNQGAKTVAYSYIGPDLTHGIYRSGTIGGAKAHLEQTAKDMDASLQADLGGHAWVSVNKALVTQASAAIPVVPLYISLLYKVMKSQGTHEGCIEQIVRLFKDHIGPGCEPTLDPEGRIRIDDWEMDFAVQSMVEVEWGRINTDNLATESDYPSFKREFRQLFGFEVEGVDYSAPTEIERELI